MMDAVIMDSETVESKDVLMEIVESKDVSTEKIESTDVLMEILVSLPPKSIFRFICVSTRWRNIIMHPLFLQNYSAAARRRRRRRRSSGGRLLAFFQRTAMRRCRRFKNHLRPRPNHYQHPLDYLIPDNRCNTLPIPIPGRRNIIDYVPRKFGYFINSSNGLILCSREERRPIYHVVNPVTRKSVSLPPPPNHYEFESTGLMCEENTIGFFANYIVVRAGLPLLVQKGNVLYIETYSSRTGEWSEPRVMVSTDNFYMLSHTPVVANGVFHWYSAVWTIVVYDPNDGENLLQLIEVPFFGSHMNVDSYAMTRSADDWLWFGLTRRQRMKFFFLPKGEDGSYRRKNTINHEEWMLMFDFNLDSICKDIKGFVPWKKIILESFIPPWNYYPPLAVVLRQDDKVFLYNLESKSIEIVRYYGRHYELYDNHLCPYIESSCLSSYAL